MPENINIRLYEDKAKKLKAMSHPHRLFILQGLISNDNCKSDIIRESINLPQSTYSQHIGKLREAGIIKGIRHGPAIHYKIIDEEVTLLIQLLFCQQTQ